MTSSVDVRPALDDQLETVARAPRRRLLLALLRGRSWGEEPVGLSEWVDETDAETSVTEMYHTHLPKLEARGYVRWDQDDLLVTCGPQFAEIEPLLTVLDDHRDELPSE